MPVPAAAEPELSLPTPWSLWDFVQKAADAVFGPNSVVAVFVAILIFIWTWLKWARDSFRTARQAGQTIALAFQISLARLKDMPVPRTIFAATATTAGLAVQAAWAGLTYVFVSLVVEMYRTEIGGHAARDGSEVARWTQANGLYTLGCCALLVIAYVLAARRDPLHPTLWVLGGISAALPAALAIVFLLLAVIVTVPVLVGLVIAALIWAVSLGSVSHLFTTMPWELLGISWGWVLGLTLYGALGFAVLHLPTWTVPLWRYAPADAA